MINEYWEVKAEFKLNFEQDTYLLNTSFVFSNNEASINELLDILESLLVKTVGCYSDRLLNIEIKLIDDVFNTLSKKVYSIEVCLEYINKYIRNTIKEFNS